MSTQPNIFSHSLVQKIAQLSKLVLTKPEEEKIQKAFSETLEVISNLSQLDTKNFEPMGNVTGLNTVLRDDKINLQNSFTQEEALQNASETFEGYFVVSRLVSND